MNREYADFLKDMLDNAQRAIQFTKGMDYKSFAEDEKTVYAVIRAVEVIGEAAAKIPADVRSQIQASPGAKSKG